MSNIIDLKAKYDIGVIAFETYLEYKKVKNQDWIKSIIVAVFPYQYKKEKDGKYLTAKFAYGKDYHLVVQEKLEEIAKELKLEKYKVMVDVSFLEEKVCAHLAGLGSIGKNSLLITPKYGTQVVIGEIVTDKEFPSYDKPIENLCTDCDICVKKCPTQALENGLDRKKCLSYLTQSTSNNYQLYDNIIDVCYGCDICQEVCYHNKKEYQYLEDFAFNNNSLINIEKLKKIDKDSYKEVYADKTFNWIGYLKMLRNIIVLEANNNNISLDDLNYFQKLYKDYSWFYDHLEHLKGKINNGTN